MKKKPYKLIAAVVLTLAFIIIALFYWGNYNAERYCEDIRDKVLGLVETSKRQKYTDAIKDIVTIKEGLNNKYVNKELKLEVDNFFTAWQEAGKTSSGTLSPEASKGFKKTINDIGTTLALKNRMLKMNQLLSIGIISLIFLVFLWLILFTNILRDIVGNSSQVNVERLAAAMRTEPATVDPPYSLSRTQLATWIAIVGSIYTYAVLWDQHSVTINTTALILMGVSVGTFAIGAIIDSIEVDQRIPRHQDRTASSGNFFQDILSDENGVSIHRFQMLVWTMIAIVVYFYNYGNPAPSNTTGLPELDTTLLALTGISSATYLTIKTRENTNTARKVLESLEIKLVLVGLEDDVKAAITNSEEGLRKALVTISTGVSGEDKHAAAKPPDSKFDFIVKQMEIGKYYKISATWEGSVLTKPLKLEGSVDVTIAENMQLVNIPIKKTA